MRSNPPDRERRRLIGQAVFGSAWCFLVSIVVLATGEWRIAGALGFVGALIIIVSVLSLPPRTKGKP